jgi:CHAT domain-containing protein
VPDKALHFLPFASLVDESHNYLVSSYRLTYSPSSSVLVRCIEEARAKPAKSSERILAVGNPDFNGSELTKLRDLPDAEQEALTSASFYGRNPITLIGPQATKQRVLGALRECDVAHLALHCLVEETSPWLAALVLADPNQEPATMHRHTRPEGDESGGKALRGGADMADSISPRPLAHAGRSAPERARTFDTAGLLYLDEVYNLTLPRTRLVVLSACQSGLGQYYRGEGMVSLVRPFLALGVPTVVASLWSVNSKATASLMIDFHSQRRSGNLETSEALRAAQMRMVRGDRFSHPFYWAPFITVGFDR